MADVTYTLQSVPKHAGATAERSAVLWPLTGTSPDDEAGMGQALQKTIAMWRYRCLEFNRADYSRFRGVKLQYARNCPPAGVAATPSGDRAKMQHCQCPTACPWCWSRLVVKRTFDQVVETLLKLGEAYDRSAPGLGSYKLVSTSVRGLRPDHAAEPRASLDRIDLVLRRTKRKFAKSAAGFVMLGVVSPCKSGWSRSVRLLALVPRDYALKPKMREYSLLTKREIARAVARFARYPKGALTGDAVRVSRLLEVRGQYRLLRFGGAFTKLHGKGAKGPPGPPPRYLDLQPETGP